MTILATLLLVAAGGLLLLLVGGRQRWGPEGPVGAHMLTMPLALALAIAAGLAFGLGRLEPLGVPAAAGYATLPGFVVAMTLLPILPSAPRQRAVARAGVVGAIVGVALCLHASALISPVVPVAIGLGLIGAVAVFGYGVLIALFVQAERNRARTAVADAERQTEFEKNQAAWSLSEWQKLPANPELWQLINLVHAFHPDVRAQCLAKIAALPDLTADMQELLGTGWAEHALRYLRDDYPLSRAPLAPQLSAFFVKEAARWKSSLAHDANPGSWYWNLVTNFDVAEKTVADGGEVSALRPGLQAWIDALRGKARLDELATRAQRLLGADASV
ncbi:MAG: hypothetical protein IPK26_28845 [Planctomycetes bacterium]|nr:hypothetical protein [Planctomycetota bacterium]